VHLCDTILSLDQGAVTSFIHMYKKTKNLTKKQSYVWRDSFCHTIHSLDQGVVFFEGVERDVFICGA